MTKYRLVRLKYANWRYYLQFLDEVKKTIGFYKISKFPYLWFGKYDKEVWRFVPDEWHLCRRKDCPEHWGSSAPSCILWENDESHTHGSHIRFINTYPNIEDFFEIHEAKLERREEQEREAEKHKKQRKGPKVINL